MVKKCPYHRKVMALSTQCMRIQKKNNSTCFSCPYSYHNRAPATQAETGMMTCLHNSTSLNEKLFEQLDRLTDPSLSKAERDWELKRTHAMSQIGNTIVKNANLVLRAHISIAESLSASAKMPLIITQEKEAIQWSGNDGREPDCTDSNVPTQTREMSENLAEEVFRLAQKLARVDEQSMNTRAAEDYKKNIGEDLASVALEAAMEAWKEYTGPETEFVSHITPTLQQFIKRERSAEYGRGKGHQSLDAPVYKDGRGKTLHETIPDSKEFTY